MKVFEMQSMEALITLNRKKKDENKPDWEQRRYEIAKAALQGILSNAKIFDAATHLMNPDERPKIAAIHARIYADALIAELQKTESQ